MYDGKCFYGSACVQKSECKSVANANYPIAMRFHLFYWNKSTQKMLVWLSNSVYQVGMRIWRQVEGVNEMNGKQLEWARWRKGGWDERGGWVYKCIEHFGFWMECQGKSLNMPNCLCIERNFGDVHCTCTQVPVRHFRNFNMKCIVTFPGIFEWENMV